MIRLIASRVFAESPSQLFETCEYWTEAVEAAVVSNRPIDSQVMGDFRRCQTDVEDDMDTAMIE